MTDKPTERPEPAAPEAYVVRDPETFARNMARAAELLGKAASAWLAPRERGEIVDQPSGTASDMVRTLNAVSAYWMSDPRRAFEAQTHLLASYMDVWSQTLMAMSGREPPDPTPRDKRFADDDWRANAFFDFLRRAYAVTAEWGNRMVADAEGLDDATREKARFYVEQIGAAMSPSNMLFTNPEALKATVASNGENLVRGFEMLAEDIERGGGELKLRQADAEGFELGRNIATTPGKVVARNDLVEIIQYEPQTKDVLKRPLMIAPPWINKYYILDLNAEKSFVDWAVKHGHTVFVLSWAQPDERHAEMDWGDYARDGIGFGLETIERATGERQVNAIGYCVGGTLLSATLALHAARGDERIASATLFTTQVDFTHAGDLKVFVDEAQIAAVEKDMSEKGYLDGGKMATAFNMLRARDLIWSYVVRNYMLGKAPPPFDLLYWNSDSTRMSAANHSYYLRNCYLNNALTDGTMEMDGETLDLGKVSVPIYNLATREDHIAPAKSVFHGCQFFGGEVTYVLSGSGHIAGVVNPPDKKKYQFWTDGRPEGEFEDWVERADETPGSWWPHWHAWIEEQDGERVPARKVGGKTLKPIVDAPGDYVRVAA